MSVFNFNIPDSSEDILEKNISLSNTASKFIKTDLVQKQIKKISNLLKFPNEELNFFLSKKIFFNIKNKSEKINFTKKLKFRWLNLYLLYSLFYPFLLIILKKRNYKKRKTKYMIDNIGSELELNLFKNFELQEGAENILYLSEKRNLKGKNIIFYNFMNTGFNLKNITYYYQVIYLSLKLSLSSKINFVYLFLSFLKEYYYYENFFLINNADFLLTHKHYETSNIKYFFFKKYGGRTYATIQKNISTTNSNSFFYYADYNFAFSEKVKIPKSDRLNFIKKNISTGSFFMENLYFNKSNNFLTSEIDKFDILYIGGNDLYPRSTYDSWIGHNKIYQIHLEWLKQASIEYPKLKFGFKHRQNNIDNFEEKILEDSNVRIINKKYNSYDVAKNSKLVLSFASTMIIELLTLGIKSFYLNPGFKNRQFLYDIKDSKKISIPDYSTLKECIINLDLNNQVNKYEFCVNSSNVTKKIVSYLNKL